MSLNRKALHDTKDTLRDAEFDENTIRDSVENIIKAVGENLEREGLKNTPERVARMYEELLAGYRIDPVAMINGALFDAEYDEMVVVRDIEFYSLCEHHMLPFIGRAHVGYIPSGKIVGLSKIPRIIDMFSRRLQVQERLTHQVADFLMELLHPKGVAVVFEGMHLCSMIRGVKKHDARMTTSTMSGVFKTDMATRMEFMANISRCGESLKF